MKRVFMWVSCVLTVAACGDSNTGAESASDTATSSAPETDTGPDTGIASETDTGVTGDSLPLLFVPDPGIRVDRATNAAGKGGREVGGGAEV